MRRRLSIYLPLLAALVTASAAEAQSRLITGRVTERTSGQGLSGATVQVAGTNIGTQAGENGAFRIMAPPGDQTLVVRYIGYSRREIAVPASQTTAGDIALEREALRLSEVVVTGQATAQERRNVSTAVSTVTAEEVSRTPAVSLDNALQGKIVGANINMNSGAPGGGGQVQIRGVTSILGNGEPLYVVDGVIISNAAFSTGINAVSRASTAATATTSVQDNPVNRLADINPNDIESVQVLKSAAATAIYGSKATNGVIIITTKRGRTGTPRFGLSQRVGQYQAQRLLGSRRFDTPEKVADLVAFDYLTQAEANELCPNGVCPYYDYQEQLFGQNDLSYETQGTISGGNENTRYFVSALNKYDAGTQINSGDRRQSVRLNLDQTFGTRWTANVSASIIRSLTRRGLSNNDNTYLSPLYNFGYTPAIVDLQSRNADGTFPENPFAGGGGSSGSNPFQTVTFLRNQEDVWRQLASGTVRYSAFTSDRHNVTLSVNGGVDRYDAEGDVYSPGFLQYELADGLPGTAVQAAGINRQVNAAVNAVWQYSPGFLGISSLTTSGGLQMEERDQNRYTVQARDLIPGLDLVNQGQNVITQRREAVRDRAFYINEDILALDERLSISGRVRGERSSTFGDRDRLFYYPAASASYRFVSVLPRVDEFKIRGAWGTSGNQPRFGDRDTTISNLGNIDSRLALGAPTLIGNPNIEPERLTEVEVGADAQFAGGRLGLEATYFDRTITNMLLTAPLPPSSGFGSRVINGGRLSTDGIELALTAVPVRTRDFTWNSRVQWYTNESVIEELPSNVADFVVANSGFGADFGRSRIACPRAVGSSVCGSRVDTLFSGTDSVRYAKTEPYKATLIWGRKIRANGTAVDTALADANPDFQMQFANDFTYKRFSFNFLLDWRKGGFVSNMTQVLFDEGGNSWDYDQLITGPDTIYTQQVASIVGTDTTFTYTRQKGLARYNKWAEGNTGVYVQDGSFVKLREVTVSYQVPERLLGALRGVRDARISLTGRNLGLWSDYWSFDPEVNNFGNQNVTRFVDLAPYPPSRSFFLAIDLGF